MSDISILDGKGRGRRVEVDEAQRLRTHATAIPIPAFVSHVYGTLFVARTSQVSGLDSHTITATGGYLLLLENIHPNLNLVAETLIVAATASDMFLEAVLDVNVGTLGNETEIQPPNLNVGSSNLVSTYARTYVWDEVGDGITGITGGSELGAERLYPNAPAQIPLQSAAILPPGKAVAWKAKGAGELTLMVSFYMAQTMDIG